MNPIQQSASDKMKKLGWKTAHLFCVGGQWYIKDGKAGISHVFGNLKGCVKC